MTKFAVLIPTYQRSNGKSPYYLERALNSVFSQTHKDFSVFVVGDRYDNNEEFISIMNKFKDVIFINLKRAKERDIYSTNNKDALWRYGGVNANNVGISIVEKTGLEYVCHLDDDDWWENNHLEEINKAIEKFNAMFVCTISTYVGRTWPFYTHSKEYDEFIPRQCALIHSSACFNISKLKERYRDLFEETGQIGLPSDADLWDRMGKTILQNNYSSILVNKITCHHDEEGLIKH